jgi:hypothetical protein
MINQALAQLTFIVEKAPSMLTQISEEKMSEKPAPNKWSKKEIIGHLIDSATNNHHRFVRGQFEAIPEIRYDQNGWNKYSFYQQIDSKQIILFWTIYNSQLIELIKRIPTDNLKRKVKVGDNLLTIEYLIIDYVEHLEHHLKQAIDY